MPPNDCLACKDANSEPIEGVGTQLVFNPCMMMPGPPTIEGHRLGAGFMAERVWRFGIASEMVDYELTREQLIVACWWVGEFGPNKKIKKALNDWAKNAGCHLWYGCINIPDPPVHPDFTDHKER